MDVDDSWREIFTFLELSNISSISLVCRKWKDLVDNYVWKFICKNTYPRNFRMYHDTVYWKNNTIKIKEIVSCGVSDFNRRLNPALDTLRVAILYCEKCALLEWLYCPIHDILLTEIEFKNEEPKCMLCDFIPRKYICSDTLCRDELVIKWIGITEQEYKYAMCGFPLNYYNTLLSHII